MNNFTIKRLTEEAELQAAFKLAERVFMEFDAPGCTKRGADSFLSFIWGKRVKEMLAEGEFAVWGCYNSHNSCDSADTLIGMMALREGCHISLAFVSGEYHRQGIGRMLYSAALDYAFLCGAEKITVNASDYGVPFYRAMGFKETDMRTITDGILYTPMAVYI